MTLIFDLMLVPRTLDLSLLTVSSLEVYVKG